MPCKLQIDKLVEGKIDDAIAKVADGTRASVRNSLKPINKAFGETVAVPYEYTKGVYTAKIYSPGLKSIAQKEYIKEYQRENEDEKLFESIKQDIITSSTKDSIASETLLLEQERPYIESYEDDNRDQLEKSGYSYDNMKSLLKDEITFNEYFPEYSHLSKEEKDYVVDNAILGTLKISCRI